MFHECYFGHSLQFLVNGISSVKGITPQSPWIGSECTSLNGVAYISGPFASSVIFEGWAAYGEYSSLVHKFYSGYTMTGEVVPDSLYYPGYILSLADSSRFAARQVVDIGVNSPRYAWSIGKAFREFHRISSIPLPDMLDFMRRHYTAEAQQTTYATGLILNLGMRSLLKSTLGNNFNESAFAGWRVYETSWSTDVSLLDYVLRPEILVKFKINPNI